MGKRLENLKVIEENFLSYCFSATKYLATAIQNVAVEDLSDKNTRDVYYLLSKYFKKYKGIITTDVVQRLLSTGAISNDTFVIFSSMYSRLNEYQIKDFAHFLFLSEQIQIEKNSRIMIEVAENIVENINKYTNDEERIAKMEEVKKQANTIGINRAQQQNIVNIYDNIKPIVEEMTSEAQLKDAVIPSGYKAIDDQSGGFRKGELCYVVGRKGDGKSVTLINFSHNAVVEGKNVIYFSLEMSSLMCQRRYLSRATQIKMLELKNGDFDMEKIKDFALKGKQGLQNSYDGKEWKLKENIGKFFVVESAFSMTTAQVDAIIEQKEQETGIIFDMAVIDYAGIMSSSVDTGSERRHQQGQVALELKRLALQRNIVVLSAAQMNREGSKKKETVSTANIAESDQIADHLDWGLAVYTHDEDPNCVVMTTIKVRDGEAFSKKMKKCYETMSIFEEYSIIDEWDNFGDRGE